MGSTRMAQDLAAFNRPDTASDQPDYEQVIIALAVKASGASRFLRDRGCYRFQ